eukprot:scaffold325_cov230-Pinguiococcus_pyrenoidosus.AAC.6
MHAGSYREPLPATVFYRRSFSVGAESRPKLPDLLGNMKGIAAEPAAEVKATEGDEDKKAKGAGYQFGMWEGVYVRCLLNILGVIMFLRLSWITGQAGIGVTFAIIICSAIVTSITTLSLSAICTNGEIAAGGLYFMISRSLGPEFGGAIGVTFYMANSISLALYVVGFGEAMVLMLEEYAGGFEMAGAWDRSIYALIAMVVLTGVALTGGAKLEIVLQKLLTVVMVLALLSFFIGVFLLDDESETNEDGEEEGLTGLSSSTISENFSPDFEDGVTWMTAFGVFFPAVTGIMAGANISGDLKDPAAAIPKGTLLSIGTSTLIYLLMALFLGWVTTRETLIDFENVIAVVEIAVVPELVYAGIFAATLSSALAQLIGAPRILLAIASDDIFPFLRPFKVTYGSYGEPLRGYLLTLGIGFLTTIAGDLNSISPLITNFFLLSYALVNYACCAATLSKSPGWRPAYKYWNPWVALIGAILCFAIMLTWWIAAFATIVLCAFLYKYIELVSKPNVNWGSVGHARTYLRAVDSLHRLSRIPDHVKNFRPSYLVVIPQGEHPNDISDNPLVHFTSALDAGQGATIIGHVLRGSFDEDVSVLQEAREVISHNLAVERPPIRAFVDIVINQSYLDGVRNLLQLSGMAKLKPNTCMLRYPENWQNEASQASNEESKASGDETSSNATDPRKEWPGYNADDYVNVVRSAFGAGMGVCILRGGASLRETTIQRVASQRKVPSLSKVVTAKGGPTEKKRMSKKLAVFAPEDADVAHRRSIVRPGVAGMGKIEEAENAVLVKDEQKRPGTEEKGGTVETATAAQVPASPTRRSAGSASSGRSTAHHQQVTFDMVEREVESLSAKKPNGDLASAARQAAVQWRSMAASGLGSGSGSDGDVPTIDVWWLVDDGGLAILLPFLLQQHSTWKGARLRVLSLSSKGRLTKEQSRMTRLLAKFRIDAEVVVVDRKQTPPSSKTIKEFEELSGSALGSDPQARYFLNVSELLAKESSRASLVVISLPIPRYAMSNKRWLAYLELMSKSEAPVCFVRGNQESVLTFYS